MQARRRLGAVIRIVATLIMLVVLITRVHVSSLVPRWDIDAFEWLGAAMVVTLVGIVLAALRWQRVLTPWGWQLRRVNVCYYRYRYPY